MNYKIKCKHCEEIRTTKEILSKIKLLNKNLNTFSLETVKDFFNDAKTAGFKINNK